MEPKKKTILAGGSGFLGQALEAHLTARNHEVIVLTRSPNRNSSRQVHWDGKTLGDWARLLDGSHAIVNLAGKSVNCRYTPENRKEIIDSRVDSVRAVGQAIQKCSNPPRSWIQSGSLAIYGDTGDRVCDERASCGDGFPVETCLLWEKALDEAQTPDTRKVVLRIGFALGTGGGALDPLMNLTRLFLGGTTGSGAQYISWLHVSDLNRMFEWAIERDDMEGIFNATGPTPVTNAQFMRELRLALHRPWSPPVPEWAVRIGARFMGTEADLALHGRRCVPKRFLDRGFEFEYPDLRLAFENLIHR
jgi:uncharacterized protein (TIGR01777 family)